MGASREMPRMGLLVEMPRMAARQEVGRIAARADPAGIAGCRALIRSRDQQGRPGVGSPRCPTISRTR